MLERFRIAKSAEVASLVELAAKGAMPRTFTGSRPSFTGALRGKSPLAVIAEYKRASPSKGNINLAAGPEQVAAAYARAGAGAISVLTEQTYFKGDMAYLDAMTGPGLPLLRKDFIVHPLQVDQTAASPASAMLLIVRMLDDSMLRALLFRCLDMGIEPVVEVFDEADLRRAKAVGAQIIQVNNRDLDTLDVDLALSKRLAAYKSEGEFWITASGIATHNELVSLLNMGFDAALVGSSLMQGTDPGQGLAALLRNSPDYEPETQAQEGSSHV